MGEWVIGTTIGDLIRDYHRDPFPHSLLRTRQLNHPQAISPEILDASQVCSWKSPSGNFLFTEMRASSVRANRAQVQCAAARSDHGNVSLLFYAFHCSCCCRKVEHLPPKVDSLVCLIGRYHGPMEDAERKDRQPARNPYPMNEPVPGTCLGTLDVEEIPMQTCLFELIRDPEP